MTVEESQRQEIVTTTAHQEVIPAPDFYQQYFEGVAMLLKREVRAGYSRILFYSDKDQPDLIILRSVAKYPDGKIGIQDENEVCDRSKLEPEHQDNLAQLNFEADAAGRVISGPQGEPHSIMKVFAEELDRVRQIPGATIRIDNSLRFTSDGIQWIEVSAAPAGIGQEHQDAPQLTGPVAE